MKMRGFYDQPAPWTTINQMLDSIKAKERCASENALAELMDWYPSKLRNYRKGRSHPADAECMQIAERLEIEHGYPVALSHAEREQNAQVKAMWLYVARQLSRIKGTARVLALVALAATSAPPPASGAPAGHNAVENIHYANRRRRQVPVAQERRRRRRRLEELTAAAA